MTTEDYQVDQWHKAKLKILPLQNEKIVNWSEIQEIIIETLRCSYIFMTCTDNEELLVYNPERGLLLSEGEITIRKDADKLAPKISVHNINEIIAKIKRRTYISRKMLNPPDLIAFENCVINIKYWKFLEHSPQHYLTKQLPVRYDQTKYPEKFEQFFSEVVNPKDQNLVLEVMAHCLLNDYRFQKAFIFLGEGATGKSTLLGVLREFLGRENVSGFQLQDFEKNQFAASNLFGKMANIAPDISSKAMYTTSVFKTLTGGDYASWNVKGKKPIDFINTAILIFSCNILPAIYEDTSAVWRRLCVINFRKSIPLERQDKDILSKLTTSEELSGILNIFLFALFRLIERGEFEGLKSILENRNDYILRSNVIQAYAENCLQLDEFGWVPNEELFRDLNTYAKFIGLSPKTKQSISKQLQLWIPEAYPSTKNISGKKTRGWKGIKINSWRDKIEK